MCGFCFVFFIVNGRDCQESLISLTLAHLKAEETFDELHFSNVQPAVCATLCMRYPKKGVFTDEKSYFLFADSDTQLCPFTAVHHTWGAFNKI